MCIRDSGTTPSRGLRRGVVINIDATVRSLLNAVEAAEMMSGREVTGTFAGIAGGHIEGINSRGVVAVTGRDREITGDDVERVIDAAKAIVIPMDREVVHVIPQEFTVDQQDGIRDRSPSRGLGDVYKRQPSIYPVSVRLGPRLDIEVIRHAFVALDVLDADGTSPLPREIDFRGGEAVYVEPPASRSQVAAPYARSTDA